MHPEGDSVPRAITFEQARDKIGSLGRKDAVLRCSYSVLCAYRDGSLVGLRGNFVGGCPKHLARKAPAPRAWSWATDPLLGELSLAFGRLKYRVFLLQVILAFSSDRLRSTSLNLVSVPAEGVRRILPSR